MRAAALGDTQIPRVICWIPRVINLTLLDPKGYQPESKGYQPGSRVINNFWIPKVIWTEFRFTVPTGARPGGKKKVTEQQEQEQ